MKIFVGMPVEGDLLSAISKLRDQNKHLPVRWLSDEDLHITLIPPWHDENIKYTKNLLPQLAPVPEFKLKFDKVELGPSDSQKRLIWIVGEAPVEMLQFKYNVESVFEKPHNSKFLLHITLARLQNQPVNFPPQSLSVEGIAKSLAIFESLGYSRYTRLSKI